MAEDLFGDIPAAPSTTDASDDLFGDIPEPTPAAPAAASPARRWMADYGLRLYKAGYRPIPIKPGEKSPDMDGWQHLKHSSLSAFRVIPRDFPNAGIGILSFNTPGVDIDVKDPGLAAELDRLAAEMLGWAPVRVGMPPKRLRAYRCATPFRKIKPWQGWVMPGEEGAAALKGYKAHNVEILAEDNQFVAMGIHPDTHRPYLWEGRGLLDVAWDGLTLVTEESLLRFMEAAEEVFLRWGCKRIEDVRGGGLGGGCGVRGARQTSERGNLGASLGKARGALDGLPNADLHYDTWIKIGLILKGAFGDEGWPLFDDWSAKSVKYSYEVTERAWDSLSPRGEVTIGTLYMMAEKATGWSFKEPVAAADDVFEDVEVGVDFEVQEAKVRERQIAEKARRQAEATGGETADGEGGVASDAAKPSEKPKDLPEIKWSGAALPEMVDKMTEYLRPISRKYPLLAFGGGVATISMRPPTTVKQVDGSTFPPAPMVDLLRLDAGRDIVMRRIQFKTKKQQTAKQIASGEQPEWKVSMAPTEAIQTFLARKGKGLYPLTGILDAPTLRPDGSLLWAPGYDKRTGLWGVFKADEFPDIPERPTHEQAVEAFNWIKREVFEGFPFKDEMALDIAVAALLTAMVRRVLDTAPGFGFSASSVSSGKTAIAALICQVATGRPAAVATLAKDEAEVAKMLLSILKEGQPVILYDNVPDGESVRSPELAKVMTNEMYTSRVLSVSETATVPTNALWLFSGNNISFVNDMATRVLTSYLMPSEARPDLRRFRRDLKTWCSENRGKAVAAALTVLRGWAAAKADGAKVSCNGSRFTEWLAMVGEAVVWAGGSDVTEGFTVAVEENPERAAMETLAAALVEIGGRHGAKAIMEMGREDFDDEEDSPTARLAGAIQSLCPGPRKSPEALAAVLRKFRNAKLTVGRLVSAKNAHSKRDEWFVEPEG